MAAMGGRGRTFPRKEQPIALTLRAEDRSLVKSGRSRLAAVLAVPGDILLRANKTLSLLAAWLIAFAPVHALAQDQANDSVSVRDRARPDYDPMGMRFGGFNLHGRLDLGVASSDNIFAEETGEDDDTAFSAGLHGRLESGWSRHALALEAGAVTTSYQDFSSEDADTQYAGIRGRFDVGARTSISGRARIAHEVEPRNDPDAPLQGIPLVEYDRTELSASVQHTFNRLRLTGTVAQEQNEYDGAQAFRDFDQTTFTGRAEVEISPRLGLLLQASTDERDYDNFTAMSSDGQTYLVGATINFTDLMRGEFAVGQFEREYDFGTTTDGLALSGELEWYITRLTTVTLTADRNSEDVIGATFGLPYVESRYGARIDHELLRNVILSAATEFGRREYDIIDRDDDFFRANIGGEYLLNRRVALTADYIYDQVESDGVARYRDYEENRFQLGVSLRL
jgi:hypothetical protein